MKKTINLFKSLSDPNRLRILKMLQISPLCVCEITEILGLSNSTVSQHLSMLKQTGFIIEKRDGRWINYLINPHSKNDRINAILTSLDFWLGDFEQLEKDKEKIKTVNRHNILCK